MYSKSDLKKLSKNDLIRIILEFQDRLEKLENQYRLFQNPHTPSAKVRSKKNTEHDVSNRFPGKPEGSNGGGVNLPEPDVSEKIVKESCPSCGKMLKKARCWYSFTQMDILTPTFITKKYNVAIYDCCGVEIDAGEHLSKNFYGPNITALAGCLKKEGLSYGAIAKLLRDVYRLQISDVTVFNKLTGLTENLKIEKQKISKKINKSSFAHMDETGLRNDGKNGFVWSASTPNLCIFEYDQSRSADVAKRMLSQFNGAIISDDYKGYIWQDERQLCWAHLLREAKEYAENNGATAQYERLKILYDKAKRSQQMKGKYYEKLNWELEDIANCYHSLEGCRNMYSKLHNRGRLWLYGVKNKNIPLTNNHAERCIRKIVLHRNRMGCIRTDKGKSFIDNFLSCTSTWDLQAKSSYKELLKHSS